MSCRSGGHVTPSRRLHWPDTCRSREAQVACEREGGSSDSAAGPLFLPTGTKVERGRKRKGEKSRRNSFSSPSARCCFLECHRFFPSKLLPAVVPSQRRGSLLLFPLASSKAGLFSSSLPSSAPRLPMRRRNLGQVLAWTKLQQPGDRPSPERSQPTLHNTSRHFALSPAWPLTSSPHRSTEQPFGNGGGNSRNIEMCHLRRRENTESSLHFGRLRRKRRRRRSTLQFFFAACLCLQRRSPRGHRNVFLFPQSSIGEQQPLTGKEEKEKFFLSVSFLRALSEGLSLVTGRKGRRSFNRFSLRCHFCFFSR